MLEKKKRKTLNRRKYCFSQANHCIFDVFFTLCHVTHNDFLRIGHMSCRCLNCGNVYNVRLFDFVFSGIGFLVKVKSLIHHFQADHHHYGSY